MNTEENTIGVFHVPSVMDRQGCYNHNAVKGTPCFHIRTIKGIKPGVCNKRARKAGMIGRITASSLRGKGARV